MKQRRVHVVRGRILFVFLPFVLIGCHAVGGCPEGAPFMAPGDGTGDPGTPAPTDAPTPSTGSGNFVTNPTMERVCAQCHGVRIVMPDGAKGEITPPGEGLAFFPQGFFMECNTRSAQGWQDTVSRMRQQNGCPMNDAEEQEIVTFLSENYTGGDPRSEAFSRVCTGCHTSSVTNWVPRSPSDWQKTVDRMIHRYDAPLTPQERTDIIGFLTDNRAGLPPSELAEAEARIYMNLVCSTCHSPKRAMDDDNTGLPDEDFRDFSEALELTLEMTARGCGLRGTTDVIVAKWLSTVQTRTPDLINIDKYKFDPATGHLSVKAWSSTGGSASLTLQGDGGLQTPMTHLGNGHYRVDIFGISVFPGRITVTSSDGGALRWHRKLNGQLGGFDEEDDDDDGDDRHGDDDHND